MRAVMSFAHFTQSYQQNTTGFPAGFWAIPKNQPRVFGGFAENFPQTFPQVWKTRREMKAEIYYINRSLFQLLQSWCEAQREGDSPIVDGNRIFCYLLFCLKIKITAF